MAHIVRHTKLLFAQKLKNWVSEAHFPDLNPVAPPASRVTVGKQLKFPLLRLPKCEMSVITQRFLLSD